MLIVGLTGGIGSGKTTVSHLFEKLGVSIIDADQISRELTLPEKPALLSITKHFGDDILSVDGTLNRAALKKIIFANPKEKQWLEELLHPLIRHEIQQQISHLTSPYCILVIPLLFETGSYPFINRVLVIDTSEDEQAKRVQLRDQLDHHSVQKILKTQVSRAERLSKTDDVIINTGSLADLQPQVNRLHHLYLSLCTH